MSSSLSLRTVKAVLVCHDDDDDDDDDEDGEDECGRPCAVVLGALALDALALGDPEVAGTSCVVVGGCLSRSERRGL